MTTPSLFQQSAFDAKYDHIFQFQYSFGNQAFKNQLIIRENNSNIVVYNKVQESFRLEHILPAGTLSNGKYYTAIIKVLDRNGNASDESQAIAFYCFTTPYFKFKNISENTIVHNSTFEFILDYAQSEGEILDFYQIIVYSDKKQIVKSTSLKYDEFLSETVSGFDNGKNYYIQAKGKTVNGIVLDTGLIPISITFLSSSSFTIIELENKPCDGCVRIASNMIIIDGNSNNSNLKYIDDTWIVLTDGNYVYWDSGFTVSDDFTLAVIGKNFRQYQDIITMSLSSTLYENTNDSKIVLKYMTGMFDGFSYKSGYIIMNYYKNDKILYTICSNLFKPEITNKSDGITVYLRRQNGLYNLFVDYIPAKSHKTIGVYTHKQLSKYKHNDLFF